MAFGLRIDETVTVDQPVISAQLDMCACQARSVDDEVGRFWCFF